MFDERTHRLRYIGSPPFASAVAQTLREAGLDVSYTPPIEQRGVEAIAEGVVVYFVCKGSDAALKVAVAKVRERLGRRGRIEVEGDDPEGSSD
jgi:hypothetical protein